MNPRVFKVEVERDGRWWMVKIPEIDGLTQARRYAEVPTMAREYIALAQGLPYDDIKVEIASVSIPHFAELLERAAAIRDLRDRAVHLDHEATHAAEEFAKWLAYEKIPVRDIAALLGVSPQRVSQLTSAK
jgi:hypothetical protein